MSKVCKTILAVGGAALSVAVVNEIIKDNKKKETKTKEQSKISAFLEDFERYEEHWEENGESHIFTVIKPSDTANSLVSIYRGGEEFDKHSMDKQELESFISFANDVWGYGICNNDEANEGYGVIKYSNGLEFLVPPNLLYKHIVDI